MERNQRTNISSENAADSVHAFEALTIVKKHGLSLNEDPEVVVNMCTEIATYKHKIKRMETILDEKERQIIALKQILKENNIDYEETATVECSDVSTQCEKCQATCETQTEEKEAEQPHTKEASTQITINVENIQTEEKEAEQPHTKEASTQITINVENIAIQYEQCAMVDAHVGTDMISRKNTGTNTNDTNINYDTKVADIHTIKSNKNCFREIERSFSDNGYRRLSTSTQTESLEKSKNSYHSADAITSLPPIEKQSLVKSRSDVHSTTSRYHRRCLPPKQRGKTWIT